jgi:hypothetical protein
MSVVPNIANIAGFRMEEAGQFSDFVFGANVSWKLSIRYMLWQCGVALTSYLQYVIFESPPRS